MKNNRLLLLLPAIFLLAGCGVKKKQLLSKLTVGMDREEVKSKMGKPDYVRSPFIKNGKTIDIWEYSLATVDENKAAKEVTVSVIGWCLFWPALLALPFMDSPYGYNTYYLEFINSYLSRWGRIAELQHSGELWK